MTAGGTYPYAPGYYDDGDRPRIVTARFPHEDSYTLERYHATEGYEGLRKALDMTPAQVHDEVRGATVLGRGGAGFPAGVKWGLMPDGVYPRYLVVNGDESEPGTYKDRLLMERDPHQLIEGCLIAAYAVGLSQVFLYIRGEMPLAHERVATALNEAYAAGYIGKNILGTDFSVDIVLHWGAGAYVVGEETALIESLEGNRGEPRLKPPYFPAAIGLYGKPTIVNNVETISNLSWIMRNGAAEYVKIGTETSPGTRMVAVSGHVKRPGVFEIVNGTTTFRDIIYGEEFCGGIRGDRELKAFVPGGGSAPWFLPEQLDLPFESRPVGAAGSMLGSGAVMVMDETTDVPAASLTLVRFYAHESCGQCTPCREGATWLERILDRVVKGHGTRRDLDMLFEAGRTICPDPFPHAASERLGLEAQPFPFKMTTICFVGPSAYTAIHSALTLFPDEFEAKVAANGDGPAPIPVTVGTATSAGGGA
ncbi:NADH-quinone oxidoreductase subunit NuoF [Actinomarinicola tropica]|uniref:NADH-quinone oxidoreductase subunit NuoF n=1 Tax=Actinomarinicola tropica TaxID=2789776 RepID=A0A5Q2RHL2_9ACTN|nr:NADH-quinone oxidoreductase subunit NuoF [Actinomarinicola tropica]QGG93806.1 NADH-quinone oxidoreductase subunit NuoF [Actinomarinicola tropica]